MGRFANKNMIYGISWIPVVGGGYCYYPSMYVVLLCTSLSYLDWGSGSSYLLKNRLHFLKSVSVISQISRLYSTSLNFSSFNLIELPFPLKEDSTQCKATWPSATPPRHRMSSPRCTNQDWWPAAPGIKVKRTQKDSRKNRQQSQQHKHEP